MLCKVLRERRAEGYNAGTWRAIMPASGHHWQEQVNYEAQAQGPRSYDILCVRFSTQPTSPDNLYVSTAAGHVMMFQVRFNVLEGTRAGGGGLRASFVRLYSTPELAGVPIYSFDVVTAQVMRGKNMSRLQLQTVDDWLLLYSKDHIVRLVSLQRGFAAGMSVELQMTGHEAGHFPVRGAMSPDGVYVACGSETGELFIWSAADGKLLPATIAPQVQLAGPVMDTIWSEHHHMLALCAVDDGSYESPPVLVFVGGDPDRVLPPQSPPRSRFAPDLAPVRPPPRLPLDDVARDLNEQFALVPQSVAPAVGGAHEWALQWANTNYHPESKVSFDEKRRLKEKIINQILERKVGLEQEKHFAGVHAAVPGGIL